MAIRVVVAGATGWTGSALVAAILKSGDLALAGAVARSAAGRDAGEAIGQKPAGVRIAASLAEALSAPSDVVVDYTKPDVVKGNVLTALKAGRHVVVEKPFTATLAEAKALVALAAARGLTLAVSQNYRYYPAAQMVADLAHRGYFGRIIGGKIDFRRNGIMERAGNVDWPHPMLADMAVHHYDLMRMVIGEASVRPIELPQPVLESLLALMRRLGLDYGAIDLRRTDDGAFFFLEVNPAGQWMFVEQRTGPPISQAVAGLLARLEDGGPAAIP